MGDDEGLMKTIHLANIAYGFHPSDLPIMYETVWQFKLTKANNVLVSAHTSLPDQQGWGRREMIMEPDKLALCFIYQVGALTGFLQLHGVQLNHIKHHGAVYSMTARDIVLARAVVGVAKLYSVSFMGLAETCHQTAAQELGVPFVEVAQFNHDVSEIIQSVPTLLISSEEEWTALPNPSRCQ